MCPLRYLYIVLGIFLTNFFVICAGWKANFDPNTTIVKTSSKQKVHLILSDLEDDIISNINDRNYLQLRSSESEIANVFNQEEIKFIELDRGNKSWQTYFDVTGVFIGSSKINVEIKRQNQPNKIEVSNESLPVTVIRPQRFIDRLFIYSVIILMSILYINFGAALNLNNVKQILRRPVGPIICLIGQFVFMPLFAYFLGILLFNQNTDHSHALALGLFFTGVSPGGGASNVWTILLGGNIDLSIAMTTISTFAAFAMMPLWIFTLGAKIFANAKLGVPYARIASTATGLLIPLAIGLAIQRWRPKQAKFLVRILKPLSFLLILFIVIFAIITNLYIFQLFSWQVRRRRNL
jgi:solute carrier family 10 (sodium/bile acid cotransporter), member 3/5